VLAGVAVGLPAAQTARATEPFARVPRYSAIFTSFPRGVRNIGMGATGTADVSGFSTGYFNPAGMAWTEVVTAFGSHEEIGGADLSLSDIRVSSGFPFHADSSAGPWHFGGSLGYARLSVDPQIERTIYLPEGTGRTFDADDWLLSGSAAASWSRGVVSIGAGGTAKFIQSSFGDTGLSQWAFDLGLVAAFPVEVGGGLLRPRAGYAALNLDTGASFHGAEYQVATETRVGVGFDLETPPVLVGGKPLPLAGLSLDYDWIDRQPFSSADYGAGVELTLLGLFHARYGAMGDSYTTWGVGLGEDFGSWLFRLDYAHREPDEPDRDALGAMVGVRW
jgi:hypothetical protein